MALPEAEPTLSLTPERWARIDAVFQAACELPSGRRAEYLNRACSTDRILRAEVEAMLAAEPAAAGFLEAVTSTAFGALKTQGARVSARSTAFLGSGRFELRRQLGIGAFGTVFEAYDRDQSTVVALKTLNNCDATALHRFKNEFRALADIYHPNLVTLYELIADGDEWFFTMELVRGVQFADYVRQSGPERAQPALRQLAESVAVLHQAGKLHCDLKPSNVLVTSEGRVVALDFGLIREIGSARGRGGLIEGTPAYMAPEQLAGDEVTEASDWYSFGVMLYQTLTGQLPFAGHLLELIRLKQSSDLVPPSALAPDVPRELDNLCRNLLRPSADERPSGDQVLQCLGSSRARLSDQRFFGREPELQELECAFQALKAKEAVLQIVQGDSGIGKTALIRHFLEELIHRESVLIFQGRCYERESVPYKALDSLAENLCEHLNTLSSNELKQLVPHESQELVNLFPAFSQVVPQRGPHIAPVEPRVRRARAFRTMRELIARLAARAPVILFIDDLQWGDQDSGALLAELFRPPDPPPVMLIGCARSAGNGGPLLEALRPIRQREPLVIGELVAEDARRLARAFIGPSATDAEQLAESIVEGAGGNPFLLQRLGAFSGQSGLPEIHDVVQSVVHRLPDEARRLLEIVAVAARPVDLRVVQKASSLADDVHQALAPLRAERLVRLHTLEDQRQIEPYHDRIRQGVIERLGEDELTGRHRSLAFALEEAGSGDEETLAVHFHAAKEFAKASRYAERAGDKAAAALAFDNAARMYRLALAVMRPGESSEQDLRTKLGDALSNAARGPEGAVEYLLAAAQTSGIQALELRRRAAAQYVTSGHLDEGLHVLDSVLQASGRRLAPTSRQAMISLLWRRFRVNLRGLNFRECPESEIAAADLLRIDAFWVVAHSLGFIDTLRAADFQASHLLYALRAGEKYRIVRALAVEAGYHALAGGQRRGPVQKLVDRAKQLAVECPQPHAIGIVTLVSGIAAFLEGRWKECREHLDLASTILQERCVGVAWELATARLMGCAAMYFCGDLKDLKQRIAILLHDADGRGDLYEATALRTRVEHVTLLAADRPGEAHEHLAHAIARWPGRGFQTQHWWSVMAQAEIELYSNRPAQALEIWRSNWSRIRSAHLLRIQYIRIESLHHRAVCALASAGESQAASHRGRLLQMAEADATKLERENIVWATALATVLRAGVAAHRRRWDDAIAKLAMADARLRAVDMLLFAAAAQRLRGELLSGTEGADLVDSADAYMAAQDIQQPQRMCALLAGIRPLADRLV